MICSFQSRMSRNIWLRMYLRMFQSCVGVFFPMKFGTGYGLGSNLAKSLLRAFRVPAIVVFVHKLQA